MAYSSDRGGKFDIWVQQVSGGDPVQITKGPGHNWQPDWSHDGKYIAYRSENDEGGLYIVPALGGAGLERKISSFGYYPRWSPDNSQIMFRAYPTWMVSDGTYVVDVDRGTSHRVLAEFGHGRNIFVISAAWHPDGKRISFWGWEQGANPVSGQCPLQEDTQFDRKSRPKFSNSLEMCWQTPVILNQGWIWNSHGRLRERRFTSSVHFEAPGICGGCPSIQTR